MSETAAQPEKKQYGVGERSIIEIIADLSKPVAQKHLSEKSIKGQKITYLAWYDATKYLDFYAPGWEYQIVSIQHIAEQVVMTVKLTIHASDGDFSREATGNENDVTSSFGDPFSNSESMALRRAAAKFGLARYLYEK